MDEEKEKTEGKETKKTEDNKSEEAGENSKDRLPAGKEDKKSLIQSAKDAAKELRIENDRREKLIADEKNIVERREALAELGGDSSAGAKPQKKEETAEEYKNRIMGIEKKE